MTRRSSSRPDPVAFSTVTTTIPARLDRLPWSRWHWTVVVGLGAVWILDGLEVTVVGSVASRLAEEGSGLPITVAQVTGTAAALYVAGACLGALFFGRLTDRHGRTGLFLVTLAVYVMSTALSAASVSVWWFFLFRFLAGFGIGGEYAAVNSAIDELIPSRYRGRVDLVVNGSYWIGAMGGALLSVVALDTRLLPRDLGWRLTFAVGVVLGLAVLLVRRRLPESPRWLLIHGREREAERLVDAIERRVERQTGRALSPVAKEITVRQRPGVGFLEIARTLFTVYPRRAVLGFALFIGGAFLYNAITFGFGSILVEFFGVDSGATGYWFAVVAFGNFLGPLLLGPLFDTWGRRPMIAGTYVLSGVLLFLTAWVFGAGLLDATTMTMCWAVVLFFASAGVSSAYLTVSEIFPMETRAMSIAFFYALGTAAGGISGPLVFADLTSSGRVDDAVLAFCVGAALMVLAGLVAAVFAVPAERRSLEDIAAPLSALDPGAPAGPGRSGGRDGSGAPGEAGEGEYGDPGERSGIPGG
ncbi:MFS transporter [Streptomyces clavuligerus]|uniref:Sugar transport protein n=1 Tax=Streptomyces clavuligerus TaxID=1901 RepID=E2Q726_STRCL|nr:MFS transporter [Streptomyces clavuligerus]ANW21558.1 MFS transporter [Streptomyces clavuligerus]AXU16188.1 MFS transporter [Streptomyces clavuligerus]EFG05273.1 Sugar transport protein [Streptomyces clavuligerus]MBY6306339.1 MFS transporter [Streptomyces clavuligerus]QCS08967.1 MFS transporter [Streptomyces clavuligerus]